MSKSSAIVTACSYPNIPTHKLPIVAAIFLSYDDAVIATRSQTYWIAEQATHISSILSAVFTAAWSSVFTTIPPAT